MLFASVKTSPARAPTSSQRCDSFSAVERVRREVTLLPLSRFQTFASIRPSRAWLPMSRTTAACNSRPPTFSAFADRTKAVLARPPAAQLQFAGVLNNDNITTCNPRRGPSRRVLHHLIGSHCAIAQKAGKPHLLGSLPAKPSDTRTWPRHQRGMQRDPPFSRRRSPNRPSPNSIAIFISANHSQIHGISPRHPRQPQCVNAIALKRGGRFALEKRQRLWLDPTPTLPLSGGGSSTKQLD